MAENFSNMGKKLNIQIHDTHKYHPLQNCPQDTYIIWLFKLKLKRILKAAGKKKFDPKKRTPI